MMEKGKVYLIGAGPGDPRLLTIKGKECIEKADVIVYDYLANEKLLLYARRDAEIIYAGKKGGEHTIPQDKINELTISKAKEGRIVARLKGGDPFIFGRGGEEAEELADAGIPFEVIPGVTAAIAVPAYAGIPLTHRDFTATVAFVTGHEDPTKEDSTIAWDKIATGIGTIVFLMGVGNLPMIVGNLIRYGRDPETPVAIIRWGTRSDQETVIGTLNNIVELAKKKNIKPPAIIVVGGVVSLRERLNWFEQRPLFGKRIIVTRAREQASELSEVLEGYGAEVIEFPTIEIIPPEDWNNLDRAIDKIEKYDWIIFTSVNGVRFFIERLNVKGKDARALKGVKLCAIGPKTAEVMERLGLRPDFMPPEYMAEGIIEGMGGESIRGKKILLPRAEVAREALPEELSRMGADVDVVIAYRTVKPVGDVAAVKTMLSEKKIAAITFTSSSTVKNFVEMIGGDIGLLEGVIVASIGPVTAKTASEYGIKTDIMPEDYTINALAEELIAYFKKPL